jgi:glycine/D-amino acid oxidase-like deaminating enzyme
MENIIVIGGGLMGSSVAWQLSNYGEKVLLLEQQGKKYTNGSSYGEARISRSLGVKKDIFSFVNNRTVEEVHKLIDFLNGLDQKKQHKIKQVYTTSPVSYLLDKELHREKIQQLTHKKQKDKYRKASGDAAFRKFGVTIPDSKVLIREYKKHSGTLNPSVLIKKLQLGIQKKGNPIKYNRKVVKLTKKNGFYEVKILNTKTGKTKKLQAKKVVVAAGPYVVPLLKKIAPYFKKIITPKRVSLSFFRIKKQRFRQLSKAERRTILNANPMFDQNGKMFFSMVEKIGKDGRPLFKVGGHHYRRNIIELDRIWNRPTRKKEIKWSKKQFRKYLEMLEVYVDKKDIECTFSYNCVYSVSKTGIPFVTNILTNDNLIDKDMVVVGGMSGIGGKGSLAYGMLATDLLLGVEESSKIYQKTKKELGSPVQRLRTKKIKKNRLF